MSAISKLPMFQLRILNFVLFFQESSEVASLQMWKRRGSCESGFFSVDDWLSMQLSTTSTRSIGSSLLTVSDLEEDLRAASAFLSSTNKRTSSIFTDSTDDLSSLAEIVRYL